MAKMLSRPKQWAVHCTRARAALGDISDAMSKLEEALTDLNALKDEYEEWLGNMPDSLRAGPTGEKLEAVVNIDIDAESRDLDELERIVDECEAAELPLGHGRD
jgi:hypothetical protein